MTSTNTTTNTSSQSTVAPRCQPTQRREHRQQHQADRRDRAEPQRHRDRVEEQARVAGRRLAQEVGRPEVGRAAERDGELRHVGQRPDRAGPRATARARRRRRRAAAPRPAARARSASAPQPRPRHHQPDDPEERQQRDGRRLGEQREAAGHRREDQERPLSAPEPVDQPGQHRDQQQRRQQRVDVQQARHPDGVRVGGEQQAAEDAGRAEQAAGEQTASPNSPAASTETAVRARRHQAPGARRRLQRWGGPRSRRRRYVRGPAPARSRAGRSTSRSRRGGRCGRSPRSRRSGARC